MNRVSLTISIAIVVAASVSESESAIVRVQSTFEQAVTDSAGRPIPDGEGVVLTGSFVDGIPDLVSSTAQQIADAFTQFGGSSSLGFAGFDGIYEFNATEGRIGADHDLLGANIYTLIGDASAFGNSSQYLIFMHPDTFTQDDNLPIDANPYATLGEAGGRYVWGGYATGDVDVGGGNFLSGVALTALIPEPSSSLLLGVAGLALLIRRKRR